MGKYPPALAEVLGLFENLPEAERRENLVDYADRAREFAPEASAAYDLIDVRKDEECTDTVGIYLRVRHDGGTPRASFRVSLGPEVQTLTRAMTALLCECLEGLSPEAIREVPQDFVPLIVGGELVRLRSQTVYYVLSRIKTACKMYLDGKRGNVQAG